MLDVHPPEHPAHSWRDFFIHIATIVVGLLIAVGLEQTVELMHRRSEVHETRERIHREMEEDRRAIQKNATRLRRDSALWLNYGSSLSRTDIDADQIAKMDFSWAMLVEPNSAWETSKQSVVFSYMPPTENEQYAYIYRLLAENYATSVLYIADVRSADAIVQRVRITHTLDAADRQRLLILVDNLNGRAKNQVELYDYLAQTLTGFLDHGRTISHS